MKLILAIFLTLTIHAGPPEFAHCFNDYQGFRDSNRISYKTYEWLCEFIEDYGYIGLYRHHSDYRPPRGNLFVLSLTDANRYREKSTHNKGLALDFSLMPQHGLPRYDQALYFSILIEEFSYFLEDTGRTDLVGWGIYPAWNNMGFHFDSRGTRARWAQIDTRKNYVAFELGVQTVEKIILAGP